MRKMMLFTFLLLCMGFHVVLADTDSPPSSSGAVVIPVRVTEKIPGANCEQEYGTGRSGQRQPTGFYVCSITAGFNSVMSILGQIMRWLVAVGLLAAVLFIVVTGFQLSLGGFDSSIKEHAKKRVFHIAMGLVLLFLLGAILTIIAPWVYT